MRPAVAQNFVAFLTGVPPFRTNFEGSLKFMYLDDHEPDGLVTTGIGNLIDPIEAALGLPWQNTDGSMATQAEIIASWNAVKTAQGRKQNGGGTFGDLTSIRLSTDAVKNLVQGRLNANQDRLRVLYPGFESWPADAQLGLLSMAWGMGTDFNFPNFKKAVNKLVPDFATAAEESHESNGAEARNAANKQLFLNADAVLKQGGDPGVIMFPGTAVPLAKVAGGGIIIGSTILSMVAFLGYKSYQDGTLNKPIAKLEQYTNELTDKLKRFGR